MKTNLFLSILLMSLVGVSQAKAGLAEGAEMSLSNAQSHLISIKIADTIDQPTTCDYTFKSFQYIESLDSIVIEASRELCGLEFEGKGVGEMQWQMPLALRGYSETKIVLNGKMMGVMVNEPGAGKKLSLKKLAQ